MTEHDYASTVAAVRAFSRFYTRKMGVLREGIYSSHFSLGQVRVLYEIANRQEPTSTEVASELGLDAAYFSRLLRDLQKLKLVSKTRSNTDRRQSHLSLTEAGKRTFAELSERADSEVLVLLRDLSAADLSRLTAAMSIIQRLLGDPSKEKMSLFMRTHQPGDMGWVVQNHGVLYANEHGYDERYEAEVAEIVGKFLRNFNQKRERCWIAEKDGENAGSVFCVKESETVARLRLLLVVPGARGLGIGTHLVNACVNFARQARYRKIILWTQSHLHAARETYRKAGFYCVRKEKHRRWGRSLIGETWELRFD